MRWQVGRATYGGGHEEGGRRGSQYIHVSVWEKTIFNSNSTHWTQLDWLVLDYLTYYRFLEYPQEKQFSILQWNALYCCRICSLYVFTNDSSWRDLRSLGTSLFHNNGMLVQHIFSTCWHETGGTVRPVRIYSIPDQQLAAKYETVASFNRRSSLS